MAKFNLSNIIPKKFSKKISVADIKQYLVDEFNTTNELQKEVYSLQDKLDEAKKIKAEYLLTLTTLDEYKNRIEEVKKRNKNLENKIKGLQETIEDKTSEIANLTLENKKMEKYIKNMKDNIKNDFIQEYKNKISNLKGHIKKDDLLNMRW